MRQHDRGYRWWYIRHCGDFPWRNCCDTSLKVAGDDFDEAIVRYVRKKHNLLIGDRTAEDIKIKIGTTYPLVEDESMEVRGRNLVTGLPKTVTVTASETDEALSMRLQVRSSKRSLGFWREHRRNFPRIFWIVELY